MVPLRLILLLSIGAVAATIPSIDSARGEKVVKLQEFCKLKEGHDIS